MQEAGPSVLCPTKAYQKQCAMWYNANPTLNDNYLTRLDLTWTTGFLLACATDKNNIPEKPKSITYVCADV